jgi:hypothetical protein
VTAAGGRAQLLVVGVAVVVFPFSSFVRKAFLGIEQDWVSIAEGIPKVVKSNSSIYHSSEQQLHFVSGTALSR